MAFGAVVESKVSVTELLTDVYLNSNSSVLHNGMNTTLSLNAGTSVPVTKVASFQLTLSSGTGTIDFRALPSTNGALLDGNGLKVQVMKLRNKSTNANSITVVPGATNGIDLFGASSRIVLLPGQECLMTLNDAAPDISATDKTLDVTGTGSQILECIFVLG